MLLPALQRLARRAPGLAARGWAWIPEALRRRLEPLVYPVAVGRRGGAHVLDVPAGTSEVPALPASLPSVSVVIVSAIDHGLLAPCLRSVRRGTPRGVEVVVVDNALPRGVADDLGPMADRWVRNEVNVGFARAANQGVRSSRGEVVVLLNDDTVVPPGWVEALVSHLAREPRLGLVCPVTNEIGSDARIPVSYRSYEELCAFATERAREFSGSLRAAQVVPLFCAALRRRMFDDVGGLDERYEVGMFEDDDLSLAIERTGHRLGIAEDAFVHHVGQASFARLPEGRYLRIWQSNRRRFEKKWRRRWRPPGRV